MTARVLRANRRKPTVTSRDAIAQAAVASISGKGPATDVWFNPETKKLELVYGDQQ